MSGYQLTQKMKSARAKMKAALNEQARHARGEPTQEDREREKYKRYSQSDKGKARYQTYWSSDKGKQVLKQYKTSRKTQQKDDRTKVMELRDAALSIGRPVRDVAPQTGHARRRAVATLPDEQIISGGPWPPAVRTLANDAQVDRLLEGLSFIASLQCATCDRCQGRWFVTPALKDSPTWAKETAGHHDGLFRRTGWRLTVDRSSGRQYCAICLPEVLQAAKQSRPVPPPPDFGLGCTVIDALTDFEELLLCPVHCVVQVYVIWATGHLKYRNFTYGVEQDVARFFETVPPSPEDVPVLQIKRGHLSWRQPFVANRARLMAAYAWLRTREKYMARRWNPWYSEQGTEYKFQCQVASCPTGWTLWRLVATW